MYLDSKICMVDRVVNLDVGFGMVIRRKLDQKGIEAIHYRVPGVTREEMVQSPSSEGRGVPFRMGLAWMTAALSSPSCLLI